MESDYRKAFTATVARFRRRSLLVLLTDLSEPAAEEFLLPAMGLLTSRHEVVIGAVRDPQVEAWAAGRTGEADAATATYLRAAALGAIEERRRVASRFRALGATVVDAAPGRLAVDLADTYLHMKAVGAL